MGGLLPDMQISKNNISWQKLSNPKVEDFISLQEELEISPNVLKDLVGFNKRAKIEEYEKYLFMVIHFPVYNPETRQTVPTELDFIVCKDKVITVCPSPNPALEKLFEELKESQRGQREFFKNTGWLFFGILDRMIDSCLPMLDHIHENIEDIEKQVFEGKEKEMLKEIAILKRDIIDFRRTIKPQRSILELLARKASRFFQEDLDIIAQEVIGSEIRVWNTLENHKDMIEAIEDTNSSLLSFQINQVMHTLTFFSIILFSLTFIAAFFTMKVFEGQTLPEYPWDLWMVTGIMLAVVVIIILLFKRKKWM